MKDWYRVLKGQGHLRIGLSTAGSLCAGHHRRCARLDFVGAGQ